MALAEEASLGGGANSSNSSNSSSSSSSRDQLERGVKAGYLAQELPELALAVRRMQTGAPRVCAHNALR